MLPALSDPTHRLLATQAIPAIGLRARWTLTDRHAPAVGSVETNTCPAPSVTAHSDARVQETADKLGARCLISVHVAVGVLVARTSPDPSVAAHSRMLPHDTRSSPLRAGVWASPQSDKEAAAALSVLTESAMTSSSTTLAAWYRRGADKDREGQECITTRPVAKHEDRD